MPRNTNGSKFERSDHATRALRIKCRLPGCTDSHGQCHRAFQQIAKPIAMHCSAALQLAYGMSLRSHRFPANFDFCGSVCHSRGTRSLERTSPGQIHWARSQPYDATVHAESFLSNATLAVAIPFGVRFYVAIAYGPSQSTSWRKQLVSESTCVFRRRSY
jgi:hypothetical protein